MNFKKSIEQTLTHYQQSLYTGRLAEILILTFQEKIMKKKSNERYDYESVVP